MSTISIISGLGVLFCFIAIVILMPKAGTAADIFNEPLEPDDPTSDPDQDRRQNS